MAAFDAAIAAGWGIECDVRVSRDGVAFVFHDALLARMTGQPGAVGEYAAAELDAMALADCGPLPRLAALLARCGDAVPLLVEIKVQGRWHAPVCVAVARDLAGRTGAPVAVMAFHPVAMRWFRRHMPDTVRGLVVRQQGKGRMRGAIERTLALWLAKPDFIACDIRDLPTPFATRARRRGLPVLTWTVRSAAQRARAATHADQIIFERADD